MRQIDWLSGAGWTVDTVGLGPDPDQRVRRHFEMGRLPAPARPLASRALIHGLLPNRARFDLLMGSRMPAGLRAGYELVLVNDLDLIPWAVRDGRAVLSADPGSRMHLDLHEYHHWPKDSGRLTTALFAGHHRWMIRMIASSAFDSRSTVVPGIAQLYASELGIPIPSIVRNSPGFVDQQPSPVDPDRIRLVYHGNAELARGLAILADTMPLLDRRFHLSLMLTGAESGKAEMRRLTSDLSDRVSFVDAVPMAEVAHRINAFDLEVIFYPPSTPNFLYSLPNKFFEAIQGRIGVISGESPGMTELIRRYGNGAVIEGWTAADLAAGLNALTSDDIRRMKAASGEAARDLNAEREREAFLNGIGAGS